jgi:hypothetical protein
VTRVEINTLLYYIKLVVCYMNQDFSVIKVTGCVLDDRVSIIGTGMEFSSPLPHRFCTSSLLSS